MLALFKFSGLIIIFISCAAFGFFKSYCLKKRADKLASISRSVLELAARIRAEKTEIGKAIPLCFEKETVAIRKGKPFLNRTYLENQDICLLEEFFGSIGKRDIDSEYERTQLFASLIEKESLSAAQKAKNLCRLYNSLGVLFGIFVCIFFL